MPAKLLPPLPRAARRTVWLARAISTVGLVIAALIAAIWLSEGNTGQALLVLGVAAAYALVTWLNPLSPIFWVVVGVLSALFVLTDPGIVSITLAVALVVLFWMRGRIQAPSLSSLTPIFTDEVMAGAERWVGELTDLGWEHVGGYSFESAKVPVTVAVLLHPDADRHAVITDVVFAIESRYDDSRFLLTINSGRAALPPSYLPNIVRGTPGDLAASHTRAIEILVSHGVTPQQLDPEAVVEEALASEVETTEWNALRGGGGGMFNFGAGPGEIDESAVSAIRIENWLAEPAMSRES